MLRAAGHRCHVRHAAYHSWEPRAKRRQIARAVVCSSSKPDGPGRVLAQGAVGLLTEGLRAAGVGAREYERVAAAPSGPVRLLRRGDVAGVLRALRRDFEQNQYFITGVLTDAIYDEECIFEDPTVRFQGRDLWKRNLQLLVPFLIEPSIQLKSLRRLPPQQQAQQAQQQGKRPPRSPAAGGSASTPVQPRGWSSLAAWVGGLVGEVGDTGGSKESGPVQLYAEWLLTCYVALPWQPYVRVNGNTTFTLNEAQNQIVMHVEAWDVSAFGALLLLLRPSDRAAWRRGGSGY